MQQKQGFSFGYKNLLDPRSDSPGPGHYYFNQSSINIPSTRQKSKKKNREVAKQIEVKQVVMKQQSLTHSPKATFAKSERKQICFILPHLSKGPQHYNINISMGSPSKAIDLAKYSERTFDYQTPVPGVGTYTPREVRYHQTNQMIYNSSVDRFRKLSYLYAQSDLGPCKYEPRNNDEILAYKFATAERIKDYFQDKPCVGEYQIQEQLGYRKTPIFSFSKNMPKIPSSYLKRKMFIDQTPSGSSYESTKSFNNAVCTQRSTKFTTSSRNLTPICSNPAPGPGSYDPYLVHKKRSQMKQQSTRSIQMSLARDMKLEIMKNNKQIKEPLDFHNVSMKNINKKQFEPISGQYDISQKIIGDKHQFTVQEQKDDFLSPFGKDTAIRTPQRSASIKHSNSYLFSKKKEILFKIPESPDIQHNLSSIFQKQIRVKKKSEKLPVTFSFT